MAKREPKDRTRGGSARIVLHGFDPEEDEGGDLAVHAVDSNGEVLGSVPVADNGEFKAAEASFGKAARFLIGPADADLVERRAFHIVDGDQLREAVKAGLDIVVPPKRWADWFPRLRCVSGEVRRCFPFLNVLDDLVVSRQLGNIPAIRKLVGPRLPSPFPWHRCSPICFGTVEVYRRVCCCRPPFDLGDILDDLPIEVNPDWPWPWPDPPDPWDPIGPIGPIGPRPGPDPAPVELRSLVFTGDALDERKVQLAQAKATLKKLPLAAQRDFIVAHPLLWCRCDPPAKVGQGFVQDGGSFTVCWLAPRVALGTNCREEFAYIVRQPIAGSMVTIYDGVAANQWFDAGEAPTLTSYSLRAVGCHDTDVPGTGAFVVLEDIGATPSHQLATPAQDSFASVSSPAYNSGLLHPAPTAADAVGQFRNVALGGGVALQYHFTESMRPLGATYYRVRVSAADANGDPTGGWTTMAPPTWATWRLASATPGSVALGPFSAGGHNDLCKIPYRTTADPLPPGEEWQDGQYHAVIPTASFGNGRHLVMIEVFDAGGNRLKPNGAPAGEAGTAAAFTFRRWNVPASTVAVPFAALTQLMWWDNRAVVADIVDIRLNGVPSDQQCQFLVGGPAANVAIGYRAYHPQPAAPSFLYYHSLMLTRGLNGPSWQVANTPGDEVGEPPAAVHASVAKTLDQLLGDEPSGQQRCAFAVNLASYAKTSNGAGRLSGLDRSEPAAFAAEIS